MALDKELMEYLLIGSRQSLKECLLTRLAASKNRRKEMIEVLDALVEETAQLIVLEWFINHGEELAGKLGEGKSWPSPSNLLPRSQPFALPRAFNKPLAVKKPRTWRKLE